MEPREFEIETIIRNGTDDMPASIILTHEYRTTKQRNAAVLLSNYLSETKDNLEFRRETDTLQTVA